MTSAPGPSDEHRQILADVATSGRRLTPAELDRYRRRGQQAAEVGDPLRAVVERHLSETWQLWATLPAVQAAQSDPAGVVRAGEALLRSSDEITAAIAEGFQLARRSVVRRQDAARREFFDDLLSGRADVADLMERAVGYGLDLAGPHAVAVMTAQRPFSDATPVVGRLERAIRGRLGDADTLVFAKEGRLVVVFAAPDAAAISQVADRLVTALGPQPGADVELARRTGHGAWRMSLGRARSGPDGVFGSYEDALEALALAERIGLTHPVVVAGDLLVYRVLIRDRAALRDLVQTVLGPLDAARRDEPLVTLNAYLESGGSVTGTARALHLSVRAVSYRLERIGAALGRDVTDPAERLLLHVAVVGARLL